jgi:hypothetical protein
MIQGKLLPYPYLVLLPQNFATMKQVRSHLRPTEDLAKVIALPADYPPHRLPTFPALERTAVLSFVDTMTQSVPAGAQLQGWIVRNPAYPFWTAKTVYGS